MEINLDNHVCIRCGYRCINRRSLGNHLARSHKKEYPDGIHTYVLHHYYYNVVPLCKCGCGTNVSWHKLAYRYNDYISGHNPGGFTTNNQPTFSKTSIKNRNAKIREAYDSSDRNIRQKISDKITAKHENDPTYKQKLSNAMRKRWKDPEQRSIMTLSRKHVWDTRHDELCEKIFTVEMRKKISMANSNRDLQHTSIAEQTFVSHLKSIFGAPYVTQKWINTETRSMCPDVYLTSTNTFVEYDGVYWHGLDRRSDWTFQQITHIANDLSKNKIAIDLRLNYVRLSSGVDLEKIQSYDDLLSVAYHVIIDGVVLKEGTFKFDDDNHSILSRETLIRINELSDGGRKITETEILPLMEKFWHAYVDYWGWFYPTKDNISSDEIINKLSTKKSSAINDSISMSGSTGSTWLKSRFRSYWNVEQGPVKGFQKQLALRNVLKYRLGLNTSKPYDYVLSDGTQISCRETFDINIKNIRFGFIVQHNAVSFFKPTAARDIYYTLLKGIDSPRVWDPSCGFGARMLGYVASTLEHSNSEYWGCEPATETYNDLCCLRDEIVSTNKTTNIFLFQEGSERCELPISYFDLVFTSPPYFDKEKYFNEGGQCWKDYPTFDSWIIGYLTPTIRAAYTSLKQGGTLAINFDIPCAAALRTIAESLGFTYEKTILLTMNSDHFAKTTNPLRKTKSEPLDIYRKLNTV